MVFLAIALCAITSASLASPQKGENGQNNHKECKEHDGRKAHHGRDGHKGHEGDRDDKEKKETPAAVTQAFQKDFPAITKMHWDLENGNYEAEFRQNGFKTSAVYDSTGYKKEVENEINAFDLPTKSQEYLKKSYPKSKIDETTKITSDKGVITYEAEVVIDGKDTDLLFDEKGNFIK